MASVEVPGRDMRQASDVHVCFAKALDLGSHYGANLNALYDRLSRDVPRPVHVVWRDASASRAQLGDDVMDGFVSVLHDVAREDEGRPSRFTVEFRD